MSILVQSFVWQRSFASSAMKVIAVKLADHADDMGRGIWPSLESLVQETDCSKATVQRALKKFVEMGLLILVKEGGRGPNSTNRYDMDLDVLMRIPLHDVAQYRQEKGSGLANKKGVMVTPLEADKGVTVQQKGCHGDAKGCHGDTQTISNHKDNHHSHAKAREDDAGASQREVDSDFDKKKSEVMVGELFKKHPNAKGLPKEVWIKEWKKLNWQEQQLAFARFDSWVAMLQGKGMRVVPTAGVYFKEKLFLEVDTAKKTSVAGIPLAIFGSAWFAHRLWQLKFGKRGEWRPRTAFQKMQYAENAELFDGDVEAAKWQCLTNFPPRLMDEKQLYCDWQSFVTIAVGSAQWDAWNAWHEANGYPPLEPRRGCDWLWVPVIDPTGMSLEELTTSTSHVEPEPEPAPNGEAEDLKKQKSNEVAA